MRLLEHFSFPWLSLAVLGFLLPGVSLAGATVYRCTEGGRTVFSDSLCPGAAGASTGVVSNLPSNTERPALVVGGGDYSTLNGDWRGQTQYQASANGQRVEAAHSVVPLVLSISADGKVTGISSSNGCKYLGVASPGVMPAMLNLDVSLSGCSFAGMNRRFSGSLVLNKSAHAAHLSLQAYSSLLVAPVALFDIKATLRR